jgi:hypothetical protein
MLTVLVVRRRRPYGVHLLFSEEYSQVFVQLLLRGSTRLALPAGRMVTWNVET